jgi:hypothetical protein
LGKRRVWLIEFADARARVPQNEFLVRIFISKCCRAVSRGVSYLWPRVLTARMRFAIDVLLFWPHRRFYWFLRNLFLCRRAFFVQRAERSRAQISHTFGD